MQILWFDWAMVWLVHVLKMFFSRTFLGPSHLNTQKLSLGTALNKVKKMQGSRSKGAREGSQGSERRGTNEEALPPPGPGRR